MSEWKTDASGNVILCPIIGWDAVLLAQTACVLQTRFVRNENQLKTEAPETIQFVLTPAQALQLTEDLTASARRVLDRERPIGPAH